MWWYSKKKRIMGWWYDQIILNKRGVFEKIIKWIVKRRYVEIIGVCD